MCVLVKHKPQPLIRMDKDLSKKLLAQNSVVIDGGIESAVGTYIFECLQELRTRGNPPIELTIASNGGDVTVGLDIYDMLATYPGAINGTVVGYARSMGVIILQACTRRLAHQHARLLIHHVSKRQVNLDILVSQKRLAKTVTEMQRQQQFLYRILAERTKRTIPQIRKACSLDKDMSAEEALGFGLIDEITPVRTKSPI